ncbi:MAG: S1 RNA-binding domain-containing protein [Clostridia bacterium]|nr:S1 RNA-binding domain-containing protein [Clostridia bacterium]
MNDKHYFPEGTLIKTASNRESMASLSALEEARSSGKILEAIVNLCGAGFELSLDLGVCRGIIPREEVAWSEDGSLPRDIAVITRVGKAVSFMVDSITRDDNGETVAYLSRRRAQEACVKNYLNKLEIGDVIDARITHFEPFGAFCDIGCGVVSLLSIDSISVSRISHPSDRFTVGQMLKAVVKSREEPLPVRGNISNGRIALSHKELLGTWQENADKFKVGQTVAGVVRSIENYGIFVELAPNLAGLAEWKSGVEVGQIASVYIKNIIPQKMKVKLVIVDSYTADKHFIKNEYFITKGNVSDWIY